MAGLAVSADDRPGIHASNAWNPTGLNLLPVPGARLYYVHRTTLSGEHTQVFLGGQKKLVFVADLMGTVEADEIRAAVQRETGTYPHLLDLEPTGERP
jgi:hypothetical protein